MMDIKIVISDIGAGIIEAVWRPKISPPFSMPEGKTALFLAPNSPSVQQEIDGETVLVPVTDSELIENYRVENGALIVK